MFFGGRCGRVRFMKNKPSSGVFFVVAAACTFALAGILIKLCTFSPQIINSLRCLFAGLLMGAYMKARGHRFTWKSAGTWLCALANFGMGLLFVMANKMTTAANAIVLQFTMPAFIILLQWIFWKKRPDRTAVIACVLSFAGILCFFLESLGGGHMAGDILALVSGILYAVLFLTKQIKGADFESGVLISFVISVFFGLPSVLAEPAAAWSGVNILLVAALGLVQQGLSYIFLNKGLDSVPPVTASLVSMVEPILNPVLVAIFYHETIGWISMIGAVIVLGSAAWYNAREAKSQG